MTEAGILLEDDPVELIEGERIAKPAIDLPHIGTVMALTHLLVVATIGRAMVSVRSPVRLNRYNEPEPDIALLCPRADRYQAGEPPSPADILLLIEVASTSLAYDRRIKLPLYARHGVPEVWIVDLDALPLTCTGDRWAMATRPARPRARAACWRFPCFPASASAYRTSSARCSEALAWLRRPSIPRYCPWLTRYSSRSTSSLSSSGSVNRTSPKLVLTTRPLPKYRHSDGQ